MPEADLHTYSEMILCSRYSLQGGVRWGLKVILKLRVGRITDVFTVYVVAGYWLTKSCADGDLCVLT